MFPISGVLLIHDGEDYDGSCCDDGPHEETDFPPELPCPRAFHGALGGLSCEKSIFLGDIAVAADVAGSAVGQEWLRTRHFG